MTAPLALLLLLLLLLLGVRLCCKRLHTGHALLHRATLQTLLVHAQLLPLSACGSLQRTTAAQQQTVQQDTCERVLVVKVYVVARRVFHAKPVEVGAQF
jgi:hypothetical protein